MTFNLAAEIAKETDVYRAGMGLEPLAQHQHLLRSNISYFYAYGHSWRQEKLAHEADVDAGLFWRNER